MSKSEIIVKIGTIFSYDEKDDQTFKIEVFYDKESWKFKIVFKEGNRELTTLESRETVEYDKEIYKTIKKKLEEIIENDKRWKEIAEGAKTFRDLII